MVNEDKISNDNNCIENYSLDIYMDDLKNTTTYKYFDTISSRIGKNIIQKKESNDEITKYFSTSSNTKQPTSKQVILYFHLDPVNEIMDQTYIYHLLNKKNSQWSPVIKEPIYKMLKQIEWKDKNDNNKIDIILKDNVSLKHKVQIT